MRTHSVVVELTQVILFFVAASSLAHNNRWILAAHIAVGVAEETFFFQHRRHRAVVANETAFYYECRNNCWQIIIQWIVRSLFHSFFFASWQIPCDRSNRLRNLNVEIMNSRLRSFRFRMLQSTLSLQPFSLFFAPSNIFRWIKISFFFDQKSVPLNY